MMKEKHSTRDMDYGQGTDNEKSASTQGVMTCKVRGLFHDLGMRNSGQ